MPFLRIVPSLLRSASKMDTAIRDGDPNSQVGLLSPNWSYDDGGFGLHYKRSSCSDHNLFLTSTKFRQSQGYIALSGAQESVQADLSE